MCEPLWVVVRVADGGDDCGIESEGEEAEGTVKGGLHEPTATSEADPDGKPPLIPLRVPRMRVSCCQAPGSGEPEREAEAPARRFDDRQPGMF